MKRPTIVILTKNIKNWTHFQQTTRNSYNILIFNDPLLIRNISFNTPTELLIIADAPNIDQTLNIKALTEHVCARSALYLNGTYLNKESHATSHLAQLVRLSKLARTYDVVEEKTEALSKSPSQNEIHPVPVQTRERPLNQPVELPGYTSCKKPLLCINGSFLGPFQLLVDGVQIKKWPSVKGKSLLAFLLYNHKQPILRDTLMDHFWPDVSPESARKSLNVALHGIRRLFKKFDPLTNYILFRENRYHINPEASVMLDFEDFISNWNKAQQTELSQGMTCALPIYEEAAALYKGDFLEQEYYYEWTSIERESCIEIYTSILDKIGCFYFKKGNINKAIQYSRYILEKDRSREDVHQRLMKCYMQLGQRTKAIHQFRKCADALKEELDIVPSHSMMNLINSIESNSYKF